LLEQDQTQKKSKYASKSGATKGMNAERRHPENGY
jgi:hypothetical protein